MEGGKGQLQFYRNSSTNRPAENSKLDISQQQRIFCGNKVGLYPVPKYSAGTALVCVNPWQRLESRAHL